MDWQREEVGKVPQAKREGGSASCMCFSGDNLEPRIKRKKVGKARMSTEIEVTKPLDGSEDERRHFIFKLRSRGGSPFFQAHLCAH